MKLLNAVGFVLFLTVLPWVGLVYVINPTSFSDNIVSSPLGLILLGVAALGGVSLALGRRHPRPVHARVLAVVFLLVPTVVVFVGALTSTSGCFCGAFPDGALVYVNGSPACAPTQTGGVCNIRLSNTGGAGAFVTGCTVNLNGDMTHGTVGGNTTGLAYPPAVSTISCAVTGPEPASNATVSGFIQLDSGKEVPFSGKWA